MNQKVSIILPWMRKEGRDRCIEAIIKNAGGVEYEIIDEEDTGDTYMSRVGVPKMIKKLMERSKNDLIMFLADDVIPQNGFLIESIKAMNRFKDGWGLVGLNDGVTQKPTHWLAHKNLLSLLGGEFFHTGYLHCFCDDELMLRCVELGRYTWERKAIVLHEHPIFNKNVKMDSAYKEIHTKLFERDQRLFWKRRLNDWGGQLKIEEIIGKE